ncbi:MAG: ketoacyl-ACP synthase III [Bradymonadales bacterium]|nr:MAG: ketoacyl-ACP synthase III [Bradymonadales bacterium]
MQLRAKITGVASYFPEKKLGNQELEKMVDTNDAWIVERTGIRERRIAHAQESAGSMGAEASKRLLEQLGVSPEEIDLIIVTTVTPDHPFPATASVIQTEIGATRAWGFDISAACSGYLYGLEVARGMVESARSKKLLLVSSEKMSSIVDYQDRSTCILFGDAGTASLIEASEDESGILESIMRLDGTGLPSLYMPAGGSRLPTSEETVKARKHFAVQDGRAVYKRAVVDMAEISAEVLERAKVPIDQVRWFIPHQANLRIIESAAKRLNLPMDRVAVNIDRYANTTSATIPSCLAEKIEEGTAKKGDLILMASFGAGFTWGATLIRL